MSQRLPGSKRLGKSVVFRVTPGEYREMRRTARALKLDLSEYIRRLIEADRPAVRTAVPEASSAPACRRGPHQEGSCKAGDCPEHGIFPRAAAEAA